MMRARTPPRQTRPQRRLRRRPPRPPIGRHVVGHGSRRSPPPSATPLPGAEGGWAGKRRAGPKRSGAGEPPRPRPRDPSDSSDAFVLSRCDHGSSKRSNSAAAPGPSGGAASKKACSEVTPFRFVALRNGSWSVALDPSGSAFFCSWTANAPMSPIARCLRAIARSTGPRHDRTPRKTNLLLALIRVGIGGALRRSAPAAR